MTGSSMVPVTVVIPVRNGADFIGECLRSVVAGHPAQVVVVDGSSTDSTLEIVDEVVRELAANGGEGGTSVEVVDDHRAGVAEARMIGVRQASQAVVAMIDVDVVLGPDDLAVWYAEFREGGFAGLQAGLRSESMGPGYWGRALAVHHVHSRSKNWFGLSVTMFERDIILRHALDGRFSSGRTSSSGTGWRGSASGRGSAGASWSATGSGTPGRKPATSGARTARASPGWCARTACATPT